MGTRALVGVQQKDGSIKYRKIFSDGYPSGTGVYILKNWNNSKLANELKAHDWLNCSDIMLAENEESFLKSWIYVDYQYLFKNGKWYIGSWHYSDEYFHDPYTGERTKKGDFPEEFYCRNDKGWELLEPKFIKKKRTVIDYIEIVETENE
jgi:hypothetical protein